MIFRSEKVNYYDLVMPYASAWTVMNSLGTLDSIQLIDLNKNENALNKTFNKYMKRCDDLLVKIQDFESMSKKFEVEIKPCTNIDEYLTTLDDVIEIKGYQGDPYLEDLEHKVAKHHDGLKEHITNLTQLKLNLDKLKENVQVLSLLKSEMPKNFSMYHNIGTEDENEQQPVSSVRFQYFCGTMDSHIIQKFQRIAYRLTRGNVYMLTKEIPEEEIESI